MRTSCARSRSTRAAWRSPPSRRAAAARPSGPRRSFWSGARPRPPPATPGRRACRCCCRRGRPRRAPSCSSAMTCAGALRRAAVARGPRPPSARARYPRAPCRRRLPARAACMRFLRGQRPACSCGIGPGPRGRACGGRWQQLRRCVFSVADARPRPRARWRRAPGSCPAARKAAITRRAHPAQRRATHTNHLSLVRRARACTRASTHTHTHTHAYT